MWARSRCGNKPRRLKIEENNYSYWWPEKEAITIKEREGKRKKKDEGMRHLYKVLSRLDGPGISKYFRVQTRLTFDAASKKVIVTN
jgi:hypothetical protein